MTATAVPPPVTVPFPGRLAAQGTGPGRSVMQQPAAARPRRRPGRKILRTALPVVLVAVIFGFALPRFASYGSAWASIGAMTWPQALLVAAAAAGSMVCSWIVICSVLPSVRLREAAAVNLSSSAVANTLPAGGALAMGVSWAMLSSWGISTADYVLYTLVSGIWNVFARLVLPVLALLVMVTVSLPRCRPDRRRRNGPSPARRHGGRSRPPAAQRALRAPRRPCAAARARRRLSAGTPAPPPGAAGWLPGFRDRAAALLAARRWRITAATAVGNLTLWLVLLACLRGIGLSQAQVPWQTSLAAFAFVRLLTVLPVTPGGIGITELGLVGILAANSGHRASAQVTAAVLLYRAVTYFPPIPLGAVACLAWRHAPTLIRANPHGVAQLAEITRPVPAR